MTDNVVEFGKEPDHGTNELTLERAAELAAEKIAEIEEEQAKIDALAEEYKQKAAPHRDAMASLKKEIRDDYSIEAKPLSTILTKRRQERRMKARIEALEERAAEQFEQMELKLEAA